MALARRSKGGSTEEEVASHRSKALHRATLEDLQNALPVSDRTRGRSHSNDTAFPQPRHGSSLDRPPCFKPSKGRLIGRELSFRLCHFEDSGFVMGGGVSDAGFVMSPGLVDLGPRFWDLLFGALSSDGQRIHPKATSHLSVWCRGQRSFRQASFNSHLFIISWVHGSTMLFALDMAVNQQTTLDSPFNSRSKKDHTSTITTPPPKKKKNDNPLTPGSGFKLGHGPETTRGEAALAPCGPRES